MKAPAADPAARHARIDEWLSFDTEGVVHIRSGRVELGQGIATAMVQIAADELDVAVETIRITQGDTRTCPAEGPTVGSLSVSIGGMAMRRAASAARAVMLDMAAGLLQTTPQRLSVEAGQILNNGTETGISYWSLTAEADLGQAIADHARPKPPEARRVAGQSVARIDFVARLGGGYFIHDLELEGLLHGRIVHVPRRDATLASNTSALAQAVSSGTEVVREGSFLGVVSVREEVAMQDAERLSAEANWTSPNTPPAEDPVRALDRPPVGVEDLLIKGPGAAAGAQTISVRVTKPVLSHGSIGPSCAVALWQDDRLSVWAHSQNVFALKEGLAVVLGLAADAVDVIFTPGAGCYGHNSADDVALDAALLSRGVGGRPVRVLWARVDELKRAPLGPAMKTEASATLDADGNLASVEVKVTSPPHSTRPRGRDAPNLRSAQFLPNPIAIAKGRDSPLPDGGAERNAVPGYAVPSLRICKAIPADPPYRASAVRSLGAYLNVIALEVLVEECAAAAGRDPLTFRMDHLEDPRAVAVIEAVARMAARPDKTGDGVGYGLGYARYKNSSGYCACFARIEAEVEVRVTDIWSAVDIGEVINPDGVINQIEGGIVQAISWTLKEEVAFREGEVVSTGWEDYRILNFTEVPQISVEILTRPSAPPLGVGEIAQGPAGAAVVNAVRSALGVAPDRLPLTRQALMNLLSD